MMVRMDASPFPQHRPRRLRRGQHIRDVVADVKIDANSLILPMFISEDETPKPVSSMPGVSQLPVQTAVDKIRQLADRGLRQFILFGVTPSEKKNSCGSYAWSPDAPVNRTLAAVRNARLDDLLMYADLCFCEYTDHGHCGVLKESDPHWVVDNDATLEQLGKAACAQAAAGADVVSPSGMMDGQVAAIRSALDQAGHIHVGIMAYTAKYASSLYGPFREAGEGGMTFGDRRGYQMDFRRRREWRTELEADLAQGADIVMVKPAVTYLDIVYQVRQACDVPVAAYHVSGEFAMLQAAAQRGWIELQDAVLEVTYAIKRAGADLILTYFAPTLLNWIG